MKFLLALILIFAISVAVYTYNKETTLFFGYALEGSSITQEQIIQIENSAGLPAQFVEFYLQWPAADAQDKSPIPLETLSNIWKQDAVPCLTWEPFYLADHQEKSIPFEAIVQGQYDAYLKAAAGAIEKWSHPLIIRFAHEMNLARYHWGTEDAQHYDKKNPEIYIAMFRYVVDFFRRHGVKNVLWAFCPNVESLPADTASTWNSPEAYYPGDSYVDILGMDGYNWGTSQTVEKNHWKSEWKSFSDIFFPLYQKLKKLAPDKPIFVFETASVPQGGNRREWMENAISTSYKWKITAIIWFYVEKETDWRFSEKALQFKTNKISSQAWTKAQIKS